MKLPTSWNLSYLYINDEDPQIEIDVKKSESETYKFINKWRLRTDYLEDPKVLKEALDELELLTLNFGIASKVGYYLSLRQALDQTNPSLKAKYNLLHDKIVSITNDIQFFENNISKISPEKQDIFLNSPELLEYKHLLELSFLEGKYNLSDEEEKIVNLFSKPAQGNWVRMVEELLTKELLKVDGVEGEKSFEEVLDLLQEKDEEVRKAAAKRLESLFEDNLDVIETEINTVCENEKIDFNLRKYPRIDSSRHISDDISSEVVDTLLETVTSSFSFSQDYYKFKAKLFDKKSLKYYEKTLEYGSVNKKYSYEDSVKLIRKVFSSLDTDFENIFEVFVSEGFIDVYPSKGKSGGAFCAHDYSKNQPTYILLNHTNRINDVLTLAHEVGHGINNEFVKRSQNNLNFDTPTSTAEVASTFMEDFVLEEILRNASDEDKLILRMKKLDSDIASIFRQVAFYNFELELHSEFRKKGYLSKEALGEMFEKHMISYLGEAGRDSNNWWVYVSHFRRSFYVYSYASGLLISKALQAKVKDNPKFIIKIKDFLSAGVSASPKDIFLNMDIDISNKSFWQQGISEIELYYKDTVKLAKKLGKI